MIKEIKKVQIALLAFGVFVVCYNFYEFITQKYSTSQGITFIGSLSNDVGKEKS
ncbi:hypothetical protein FRZ43_13610 [Enterococcus faecium]|nr:hypothetical protein [Enterococcus faecium]